MSRKLPKRLSAFIAVLILQASWAGLAAAQDQAVDREEAAAKARQEERDKQLAELLTGCKFVGRYTVSEDLNETPKADEYHIQRATKVEGDKWRFLARIKYGSLDVSMPLPPMEVQWAGDTPVIVLDKLEIPGMGTFSARVVIHGKKYAASWDGGDHGGFMWGTIERAEAEGEDGEKVNDDK